MFRGSGHYVGMFFVGVIIVAVFALSVTLSLTFFQGITPVDKPWFPYLGLSLTEVGFLCWMFAFLLLKHHGFHTAVALIMSILSFVGIVCTAGIELFSLMPGTTINVHAALFANAAGGMLDVIFLANLLSTPLAFIVHYNEKNPGWFSGNRNLIPVKYDTGTGYLPAYQGSGETDSPLVSAQFSQTGQVRASGKATRAGSSTIQADTGAMRTGTRAGRVPGKTNTIMSESTSAQTDYLSALDTENENGVKIIPLDELR